MKYEDLTGSVRKHFDALIEKCGYPPEGATHFDIKDASITSWAKFDSGFWYHAIPFGRWKEFDPVDFGSVFIEIPDKPWCCQDDNKSVDVALTAKPKIRKIVYDRKAFNTAIDWILNNNPYAKEDWRNTLPLDVRRWMRDLIKRYDKGNLSGVSYVSSAGLTLVSSWESEDVLRFDLLTDVNVGADCCEYEYDVEDVF